MSAKGAALKVHCHPGWLCVPTDGEPRSTYTHLLPLVPRGGRSTPQNQGDAVASHGSLARAPGNGQTPHWHTFAPETHSQGTLKTAWFYEIVQSSHDLSSTPGPAHVRGQSVSKCCSPKRGAHSARGGDADGRTRPAPSLQ